MAKYGSPSVAVFLADGYDLLPQKAKGLSSEIEATQEDTTGLGDAWPEHTPTGLQIAQLSQDEAFYDAGTDTAHEAFQASGSTARVICYVFEGNTIGEPFVGHEGALGVKYGVLGKNGGLTKAKVEYRCSGQRDEGVILQDWEAKTSDWDTTAESVDNAASSSAGGAGYLQVSALSGFTGFVGKIQHSADDISYADLVTFTNVTAAPAAERIAVSGTVNRYLAFDGNVSGTGSITVFAGFARGA